MNFSPPRPPEDDPSEAPPATLTEALRAATRYLHQQAERSGAVTDILHGRVTRAGYALLLRSLLPAYEALEAALVAQRSSLPAIARDEVFRASALRSDLRALVGPEWESDLPMLTAAEDYRDRIRLVADDAPRLLGHAYVRYFGDLNGGQILKKLLARSLELTPKDLSFYDFPAIAEIKTFKREYREAFDAAVAQPAAIADATEEAVEAFQLNIRVSEAVRAASAGPSADADFARP